MRTTYAKKVRCSPAFPSLPVCSCMSKSCLKTVLTRAQDVRTMVSQRCVADVQEGTMPVAKVYTKSQWEALNRLLCSNPTSATSSPS
ncbi:hypothetical protein PSAB6_150027 [Paraburkholderia sabiae]|nr:hypothetical protein PSAB6_150027 [Paraburkholderia sabiae]